MMILLSFVQPVSVSPVQPRPAPPVPSPETELEQAKNLSAALGAYGGGDMFYAYVSSSLQQLRERRGASPLAARAPSPVPQARAVAVAQAAPTASGVALAAPASLASGLAPPRVAPVAAAPASQASGLAQPTEPPIAPPTPTEQSADLGECAEALLELSRTTRRRPRDSGAAEAQWSVWSGSPAMDPSAVTEQLKKAEASGDINSNSCRRLEALHELLIKCQTEGILTFEVDTSSSKTCIMGWSKMNVIDPAELNSRIREMVKLDLRGIWRRANGMHATQLKNPSWGVYELLRKIGVKPRLRGPDFTDPGKHDMVYYKQWSFVNGPSFQTARIRLAKGYSYCPEKGGRERKIRRVCDKPG
jgi:hypothetical protein